MIYFSYKMYEDINIGVFLYIYMCVCVYVYIYIYVYVCIYIYIYIYMCVSNLYLKQSVVLGKLTKQPKDDVLIIVNKIRH